VNTWKVILATMVIFGAGVVTGGLLVHSTARFPHNRQQPGLGQLHAAQPGPAGIMRLDLLRRMERDLDLKPDQRERVDKILKAGQERTKEIMEPIEPDLREVVQQAREEFLAVLTPEQRARFEALLKQQQQQRAKEQHKQPPPPRQPNPAPPVAQPSTNLPPANR
jgi:Spy/CpxP family protein refolding chaperone